MFPIELAKMMIKLVGTPSRVLDPFIGSGTTAYAAKDLGVVADGVDLEQWWSEE